MQKIPVFKTFGNMVDSIIENLGAAFSMSWPWLLVLFPIRAAGDLFLLWSGVSKLKPTTGDVTQVYSVGFVTAVLTAIIFSSIAVNWHRFILRNEVAEGSQRLRLDGLVWRYFLFVIVIALIMFVVIFGGVFGVTLVSAVLYYASNALGILIGVFVGLPLALLLFGMWARWSVKLVAIAMGNIDYTLSDAWRDTKGNTWRLTGLEFLFGCVLLLIGTVNAGTELVAAFANSSLVAALAAGVTVLVGWFSTLMGITMLTSIYAFFVEKKQF
ncbi:MAG TPA: hypothetical protein VIJ49_03085 [Aestuariivirga sp.]